MNADELADILETAFAESGQKPGIPHAVIWWEALHSFPAADVRREVIGYVATHKWPPKASEIARRLRGFDEHATTRAVAAVEQLVASGAIHPSKGQRADRDVFPDQAAYDAYLEIGQRAWYDFDVEFMRKRFTEVYERHATKLTHPALTASPDRAVLPDIGKRVI